MFFPFTFFLIHEYTWVFISDFIFSFPRETQTKNEKKINKIEIFSVNLNLKHVVELD